MSVPNFVFSHGNMNFEKTSTEPALDKEVGDWTYVFSLRCCNLSARTCSLKGYNIQSHWNCKGLKDWVHSLQVGRILPLVTGIEIWKGDLHLLWSDSGEKCHQFNLISFLCICLLKHLETPFRREKNYQCPWKHILIFAFCKKHTCIHLWFCFSVMQLKEIRHLAMKSISYFIACFPLARLYIPVRRLSSQTGKRLSWTSWNTEEHSLVTTFLFVDTVKKKKNCKLILLGSLIRTTPKKLPKLPK